MTIYAYTETTICKNLQERFLDFTKCNKQGCAEPYISQSTFRGSERNCGIYKGFEILHRIINIHQNIA